MSTLQSALNALRSLEEDCLRQGNFFDCEIDLRDGDWDGMLMTTSVSPLAAVSIARQLIELVERDIDGAHIDIDRASLVPDAAHQLRFSLKTSTKVAHA